MTCGTFVREASNKERTQKVEHETEVEAGPILGGLVGVMRSCWNHEM